MDWWAGLTREDLEDLGLEFLASRATDAPRRHIAGTYLLGVFARHVSDCFVSFDLHDCEASFIGAYCSFGTQVRLACVGCVPIGIYGIDVVVGFYLLFGVFA